MEESELLLKTKRLLNTNVTEHLEKGIDLLLAIINEDSKLKMDIYQFKGKYNEIEQDTIQGIIKYDDKMFYSNKIRIGLLEIITRLKVDDLSIASKHWSVEEKELLKNRLHTTISTATTVTTITQAVTPPENKEYTAEDLALFRAKHSKLLTYFPVLYRNISAIVYRQSGDPHLMTNLHHNKGFLEQYKMVLNDLQAIRNDLSQLEQGEYYDLLIKSFINFKSQLNPETINDIGPKLEELNQLSTQLKNAMSQK